MSTTGSQVTAIVPTCRPGEGLRALLRALSIPPPTPRPPGPPPAILLIDSSPDPSAAKKLAQEFDARFERVGPEGFGHGRTRNKAAALCETPFVAFFTQDALPADEKVITYLLEAVRQDGRVAGAYARQIPREDATARTRAEVTAWFLNGGTPTEQEISSAEQWDRIQPFERYRRARFDNVASLIRRDVLLKIPFPETYFGEDVEWGLRVLKAGYKIVYEPRAQVIHSHDRSAFYEFRRTVNCHARLQELFGLRTVPSFFSAVGGFAGAVGEGMRQTLASGKPTSRKMGELARLPGREAARAFGQYVGGWLGARGLGERFHFEGV